MVNANVLSITELINDSLNACEFGRRIIVCDGVFDLIHPGHIEHLRQAKKFGSYLVVLVAKDSHVNKGPGRPVFSEDDRVNMVAAINSVNAACLVNQEDVYRIITEVQPDFYCKGEDYKDSDDETLLKVKSLVESYGGELVFTNGKPYSSSKIAKDNGYIERENSDYLEYFSDKYPVDDIFRYIDDCSDLEFSVIGEPILDEYIFCKPEGKSAKDNIVTYSSLNRNEVYEGGASAVVNHLKNVCSYTDEFVHEIYPVHKTRYIEEHFNTKLFAFDSIPSLSHDSGILKNFFRSSSEILGNFIIADFGHGLIDSELAESVSLHSGFLACTVQSNGLNWGFNTLNKYRHLDYVVVDEIELHLAVGDKVREIRDCVYEEFNRLNCKVFMVTLGHNGCLIFDGLNFYEVPAFANKVVDRVGAGDAVLAWTSPLVRNNTPAEIVGFIGNVVGGIQVGTIGNSEPVTKSKVKSWIKAMLI